jgi:zona occludens toxin
LWKTLRGPSIVMGLALVIGVVMFLRFFFADGSTGEESKLKEVVKTQKAAIPAIAHAPGAQPATVVTKVVETPKTKEKLPAGVQYILDMAANARARHAGWYGQRDIVEFRASGGGQVLDRFTTEQLWALGWSVKRTEFGVLLSAKGHEIIATTWPVDPFGEQSDATTARIKAAAGSPVTSASETQPTTAAANGSTLIAVGKRPLGTFPETPPYPASF